MDYQSRACKSLSVVDVELAICAIIVYQLFVNATFGGPDVRYVRCRFPDLKGLAQAWKVKDVAGAHWSLNSGWGMVEACAEAELDELRSRLRDCDGQMVGVVVDESTANNNNQYLVIGMCG